LALRLARMARIIAARVTPSYRTDSGSRSYGMTRPQQGRLLFAQSWELLHRISISGGPSLLICM
jgi:hypothetical protein